MAGKECPPFYGLNRRGGSLPLPPFVSVDSRGSPPPKKAGCFSADKMNIKENRAKGAYASLRPVFFFRGVPPLIPGIFPGTPIEHWECR